MESLTIEKIYEAIKAAQPKPIDFKPLNDLAATGASMDNITLVTSHPDFKEVTSILTTQGELKVLYSPLIPKDSYYLMNPPKMEDWLKPNWSR